MKSGFFRSYTRSDILGYLQVNMYILDGPTGPHTIDYVCQHGTYHPEPTDCKVYLQCAHNQFIRHTCPPGTMWSQPQLHCVTMTEGGCTGKILMTIRFFRDFKSVHFFDYKAKSKMTFN